MGWEKNEAKKSKKKMFLIQMVLMVTGMLFEELFPSGNCF